MQCPSVLLSQETPEFRQQSRQGGAKVRRKFCQVGRGSIY